MTRLGVSNSSSWPPVSAHGLALRVILCAFLERPRAFCTIRGPPPSHHGVRRRLWAPRGSPAAENSVPEQAGQAHSCCAPSATDCPGVAEHRSRRTPCSGVRVLLARLSMGTRNICRTPVRTSYGGNSRVRRVSVNAPNGPALPRPLTRRCAGRAQQGLTQHVGAVGHRARVVARAAASAAPAPFDAGAEVKKWCASTYGCANSLRLTFLLTEQMSSLGEPTAPMR